MLKVFKRGKFPWSLLDELPHGLTGDRKAIGHNSFGAGSIVREGQVQCVLRHLVLKRRSFGASFKWQGLMRT